MRNKLSEQDITSLLMALVDYGSSDSEQEQPKPVPPKSKQGTSTKQTFEKFVDKSNPGKIRLNLASDASKVPQVDPADDVEPPAKRAKTGGFGGFNSMLPAPKRATGTIPGLRKGVNLKTGAEPAFSRDPMPEPQSYDMDLPGKNEPTINEATARAAPSTDERSTAKSDILSGNGLEAPPKKKATIFKPLSVARKPQKKRPVPIEGQAGGTSSAPKPTRTEAAPKLSLFSIEDTSETTSAAPKSTGTYQPVVYQRDEDDPPASASTPQSTMQNSGASEFPVRGTTSTVSKQANSLDDIAADLNLSASARRQLLGRNQRDGRATSIKITNFNTDEEYAANEVLRQSGEIVQHNAVRGIAPGKHSLKQLVNAATNQKDALEEQFAAGRRNKSEAGAKYGW